MDYNGPKVVLIISGNNCIVVRATPERRARFTKDKTSKESADMLRGFLADAAQLEKLPVSAIHTDDRGDTDE